MIATPVRLSSRNQRSKYSAEIYDLRWEGPEDEPKISQSGLSDVDSDPPFQDETFFHSGSPKIQNDVQVLNPKLDQYPSPRYQDLNLSTLDVDEYRPSPQDEKLIKLIAVSLSSSLPEKIPEDLGISL